MCHCKIFSVLVTRICAYIKNAEFYPAKMMKTALCRQPGLSKSGLMIFRFFLEIIILFIQREEISLTSLYALRNADASDPKVDKTNPSPFLDSLPLSRTLSGRFCLNIIPRRSGGRFSASLKGRRRGETRLAFYSS